MSIFLKKRLKKMMCLYAVKTILKIDLGGLKECTQPQRELRWLALFSDFTVSCFATCICVMSSFSLHFDNVHSHSLVWFSSVCLVQCRQPVGLLVCTMTREGAITLVKVLDCVCACVFQTEPTAYQAEIQRSLSDRPTPVTQTGEC